MDSRTTLSHHSLLTMIYGLELYVKISSLFDKTWFIVMSELKGLVLFELQKWHGLYSTFL